jgi:hypothetical protein
MRFRIETSRGLLWTWKWTFGFYRILRISEWLHNLQLLKEFSTPLVNVCVTRFVSPPSFLYIFVQLLQLSTQLKEQNWITFLTNNNGSDVKFWKILNVGIHILENNPFPQMHHLVLALQSDCSLLWYLPLCGGLQYVLSDVMVDWIS